MRHKGFRHFCWLSQPTESAVNGTQLKVVFNKELNQQTAETSANYAINDAAIAGATFKLQDDKKSVVITVPVKFTNDSTFMVKVSGGTTIKGDTVADYAYLVSFADHPAPTAIGVTYLNNNTARISFSKAMSALAAGSIQVYSGATNITGAGLQSVAGVVNGDDHLDIDVMSLYQVAKQ